MKNVITLGKLIGLLLLFSLSLLLSVNVHTKTTRNELAHLVMGTIYSILHILTIVFPDTRNVEYLP